MQSCQCADDARDLYNDRCPDAHHNVYVAHSLSLHMLHLHYATVHTATTRIQNSCESRDQILIMPTVGPMVKSPKIK